MATELKLNIVTPEREVFSGQILAITLSAWEGQEGVYPDHDSKLALLRAGVTSIITTEGEKHWVTGRGFAEMDGSHVTLLTDSCVEVSAVDKAAAEVDLRDAEAGLAKVDWVSEEAESLRVRQELALAELSA
jgi:F-type H+-transporting ATPase subunit epsilon